VGAAKLYRVQKKVALSAALILWAAGSAVLALTTVPAKMPGAGLLAGGEDLWVYREAARNVTADLDLYSVPVLGPHYYTYTPFSAITFLPLGLLPGQIDKYIWMVANLIVLAAAIGLCWYLLGYRITPAVVWASTLMAIGFVFIEPVRTTLFYGQINPMTMLLVLWDTSRRRSLLKGIGIGVAAGVKLTPAYFAVYYLAIKQWRAVVVAAVTFAITVCIGWMVLPHDSRVYWTSAFMKPDRVADNQLHPANQSLRGALGRLLSGDPPSPLSPVMGKLAPAWLWLLIATVVVVVSMAVAVKLYRNGERLLSVSVTGLTATVLSPFSWTHHWLWMVPVLVYFMHRALSNGWWWLAAATLFAALGSWTYRFPSDHFPRIGLYVFPAYWVPWEFLVNLYVVLYAAVMVVAAVIAYRPSSRPAPPVLERPTASADGRPSG
jgi:alpha-1,2-mannosyltransferase